MKLKEKFDSIDQSKLNANQKDFLSKIEKATKNFTSENKEVNDKVEGALDKMIATFKEKIPEAIKTKEIKAEPKASAKKAEPKASAKKAEPKASAKKEKESKTNGSKRGVMSVAKEIRKEGESWADAQKRAKAEMNKDKQSANKEIKTEMKKLLDFIKTRKELEGISGTDLPRDSVRQAKPRGRRISKDGNVYYESRDRHSDRLAPNYPKDAPLLAGGGYVEEIYFFQCKSKEIRDDFYKRLQAFMPDNYKSKMGDRGIQLNASPNDEEILRQMANSTDGVLLIVEKYEKGGGVDGKNYYTTMNVGKAKYVVNYHNGVATHRDGSPFYDIAIFKNKNDLQAFISKLSKDGYKEKSSNFVKGGMLTAKERYVLEIKGQTGLTVTAIEKYISENNLNDDEVLNIVVGLGRKQLKGADVATAFIGHKGNAESKKLIDFVKDNKAMKMELGGYFKKEKDVKFKFAVGENVKIPQMGKKGLELEDAKIVEQIRAKQNDGTYYPFYYVKGSWNNADKSIYDEEKLVNYQKGKFELGGTVVTDLAGHTGGGTGFGNQGMLDGFSNTAYSGLVGETGAMSSGEMFEKGGALTNERRHVNYSQDYEVRYAKNNPNKNRRGYGNLKFYDGGDFQANVYADGGLLSSREIEKLDRGFKISQLDSMLTQMFPDSFQFEVYKQVTLPTGSSNFRHRLHYDYENKVKDDKLELYFYSKSYGRDLNYEVYQGQENTFFKFLLTDNNVDTYVGTFGFKDEGTVDASYITKFISFLQDAYHYPLQIKHSVMENGGDFQANVYDGGGKITKSEVKANLYKPSGDYYFEQIGNDMIVHLTSKDAGNSIVSLENKFDVKDNGKGYYGSSYILSRKKYENGGDFQANVNADGGKVPEVIINKDGIRVSKMVEPKKKLTEKEWMAKYSESKEARAYKYGGKLDKYSYFVQQEFPRAKREANKFSKKYFQPYVVVVSKDEDSIEVRTLNNFLDKPKSYQESYDVLYETTIDYEKGGDLESNIKNRLSKNFNLPLEVVVYVPSTKNADELISEDEFEDRVESVQKYLSNLFGGFSANDVDGGYMSQEKGLITEEVYKVISFAERENFGAKMEKLVGQVKKWANEWGQESIGLEFEGDLFYIDQKGTYAEGGEINAFSMRLVKGNDSKPDEVMTDTQKVQFVKGGSLREKRNDYLSELSDKESDVWDKIGANSGSEIRGDKKLLKAYAEGVEEMLIDENVQGRSFDQEDYDFYTDQNSHLFNEFLVWNGYYKPEMTVVEKKWREKSFKEGNNYVSDPNVIFVKGVSSSEKKSKNYIVNSDIKSVTVNQKGVKYTFKGSDVLNGVNILEKGNVLETKAIYIPKRDVISVQLKDGSEVKPLNGYWIKKEVSGEIFKPKAEKGAVVKKKSNNPKAGGVMVLAKEIRKDGEKWTDAVKRASIIIKNK